MKSVEVYILSGFLGAGKTTLLKNILKQEQAAKRKIAVIMNELGKVSIDSDAIADDIPLKELLNGCVCCTMQGQLEAQLQGMLLQYDLDAIYIETTGAAHPIEVLDSCLSPVFADKLSIRSILTLVDGGRYQDRHALSIQVQKLLQEQIHHADLVIINKIDHLSESEQAALVYDIQNIASDSKVMLTQFANIRLSDFQQIKRMKQKEHQKSHVQLDLHLKTYVHTFEKQIDFDAFEDFLRNMPDTIYRIKGYLSFTHSADTYLFQYSYGMPLYLKEPVKMKNTVVFIGENLDHSQLHYELNSLQK
ncbi:MULTISPECIES: CobW family GTP-binding protein [Bacillaceae]|uniref:CobW family GTP-binding protein n=1 Tax=Bacillaceae TaxID=186817 RepID=UPI000C76E185|nr:MULTISPECIES: CobW family GTP-binding protein [Bacillaceae]PLR69541.1 cobalamin biosynthesis protein [Bacillus sp. UMB0893]QNG58986.1 GTP-binding protein [Bacillus sp. PAMC26568]